MTRKLPMSLQLVTTAMNAAVYAGLGALWTVFPVTVYGIRFWPQVFVPASFSVLFGAWTGGVGAAIGIFLADVIYGHHDALLSLLVGVPSNFCGFFIIGWLSNRNPSQAARRVMIAASLLIPVVLAGYGICLVSEPALFATAQLLLAFVCVVVVVAILGLTVARNRWATFESAASIGLGIGSVIIGIGIVAYSSFFTLPAVVGKGPLPISIIYAATTFTYLSEIPFMVLLTPPIVSACRAGFPSLRLDNAEAK